MEVAADVQNHKLQRLLERNVNYSSCCRNPTTAC